MADAFKEIIGQLARMQWSDYLDIILVTVLLYLLLPMFKTTGATRILRVVIFVFVVTWLTELLQLYTLNYILNKVLEIGLIAIVILFQPELRRMLDQLTNMKLRKLFSTQKDEEDMSPIISQVVMACDVMSREKVGALIVFGRDSVLDEYTKAGTPVDAQVSEQLIRNIFFTNAALHDGAMIVRDCRIAAAGCVLPLSESSRLSLDLGTRHRAAVGMSEVSDAVVVVVSEETGAISVAIDGMLKRHLAPQTLERLLRNELCVEETQQEKNLVLMLRQKLQKKEKGEKKQ